MAQNVAGALVARRDLQAEAVLADRSIGWGAELQREDIVPLVQHGGCPGSLLHIVRQWEADLGPCLFTGSWACRGEMAQL